MASRNGIAGLATSVTTLAVPDPDAPAGPGRRRRPAVSEVLVPALISTARRAVDDAAAAGDMTRWGCVVATESGTASTAELIAATLADMGPQWIDPDVFLYYSPHALTGELCIALGLGGPGLTLRGAGSGVDGLGMANWMLRRHQLEVVLVVAVDWLTGLAASRSGQVAAAGRLAIVAAVLTPDGGRPQIVHWGTGSGDPATPPEPPRAVAPLLALAARRGSAGPGRMTLTGQRTRLVVAFEQGEQ